VVSASADPVWSADITDIRLRQGFVSVVAMREWYSRDGFAWEISVTLDRSFCLSALERAFRGTPPTLVNTDHGGQFTSRAVTGRFLADGMYIRMDGRGRAFDHIFVERRWRRVKYEEVYLTDDQDVQESLNGWGSSCEFSHPERLHQSLAYRTPAAVYRHGKTLAAATPFH
jgi:putative transposase